MTFALALGLGIEGRREVVDLELAEPLEPAELLGAAGGVRPAGLRLARRAAAAARRRPRRGPGRSSTCCRSPQDRHEPARVRAGGLAGQPRAGRIIRRRPDRESGHRPASARRLGRADRRRPAPFPSEGLPRRLRASRRTARGARLRDLLDEGPS